MARGTLRGGEASVAAWEHWDFPQCGETGSESLLGQAGPPATQYLPRARSLSAELGLGCAPVGEAEGLECP